MLSLAIAVGAIALPDSINPSLILAALYLAAGPHPRRRTAVFTAAAMAVTFAGGLLFAIGLGDLLLSLVPKPMAALKWSLVTAAGAGLLGGGCVIWLRRETLSRRKTPYAERASVPGGSALLLGAGIAGVELLTAFPYFAAITLIVGSSASQAGKLALLVFYNVVYALPLIAIVVICALMGQRAVLVLERMRRRVLGHWPAIVGPLAAVVGAGLIAYGTVRLA